MNVYLIDQDLDEISLKKAVIWAKNKEYQKNERTTRQMDSTTIEGNEIRWIWRLVDEYPTKPDGDMLVAWPAISLLNNGRTKELPDKRLVRWESGVKIPEIDVLPIEIRAGMGEIWFEEHVWGWLLEYGRMRELLIKRLMRRGKALETFILMDNWGESDKKWVRLSLKSRPRTEKMEL